MLSSLENIGVLGCLSHPNKKEKIMKDNRRDGGILASISFDDFQKIQNTKTRLSVKNQTKNTRKRKQKISEHQVKKSRKNSLSSLFSLSSTQPVFESLAISTQQKIMHQQSPASSLLPVANNKNKQVTSKNKKKLNKAAKTKKSFLNTMRRPKLPLPPFLSVEPSLIRATKHLYNDKREKHEKTNNSNVSGSIKVRSPSFYDDCNSSSCCVSEEYVRNNRPSISLTPNRLTSLTKASSKFNSLIQSATAALFHRHIKPSKCPDKLKTDTSSSTPLSNIYDVKHSNPHEMIRHDLKSCENLQKSAFLFVNDNVEREDNYRRKKVKRIISPKCLFKDSPNTSYL